MSRKCAPKPTLRGKRILLARTQSRASRIAPALELHGARVVEVGGAGEPLTAFGEGVVDMIVFPSSNAVTTAAPVLAAWHRKNMRPAVAAIGPASAAAAAAHGFAVDIVADDASIESLVAVIRRYFANEPMSR